MAIPLKYNRRSLLVRRVSNVMTGGGIALVVAVFVIVMAMVAGLSRAIRQSGSDDNLIVLSRGSTTETGSSLKLDQFDALKFLGNLHVKTLQRYARLGRLPGYQIGRHWYFRESELDAWLRLQLNSKCQSVR